MPASPMARTLEALRKDNAVADIVERRLPHSDRTKDFLGIIDVIAVMEDGTTLGIQATTGKHGAERVNKLAVEKKENSIAWLKGRGNRLEIWAWKKYKHKGWRPRITEIVRAKGGNLTCRTNVNPCNSRS